MDDRFKCVPFSLITPECIALNPTQLVCVCPRARVPVCVCVCVFVCWCIGYLSGLLTVPYQSSSYEPDRWDFKPEINLSMCMHECVCCILTAWKWINSAVNSTPPKILCMYEWLHVCGRPRGREACERDVESACWLDWFSRSHLKCWMTWSPVAITSLKSQSPLHPNTTEHNAIHLPHLFCTHA